MLAQAGDVADATRMATAQLQAVVRREAFVMTYSDCFYLMGAALLLSLIPILFMGRPGKGKAPAER
jgi:DHA2 family multidrug resistance protein